MLPEKQFALSMVELYDQQEACVKAISDLDNMSDKPYLNIQGVNIEKGILRDSLLVKIASIDIELDKLKSDIILYLQEDLKT